MNPNFYWRKATILDLIAIAPKFARFRNGAGSKWQEDFLCDWIAGKPCKFVDSYGVQWNECEVYCGPPQYLALLDDDDWGIVC